MEATASEPENSPREGPIRRIVQFENKVRPITVVVMPDTSASMTPVLNLLIAGAEQFIIRMLPDSRGKVDTLNDKVQILPEADFIGDRDALIRTLDRLQFGNPTQPYDAIGASIDALQGIEGGKVVLVFTHDEVSQHAIGWRNVLDKTRVDGLMIYTSTARATTSTVCDRCGAVRTAGSRPSPRKLAAGISS